MTIAKRVLISSTFLCLMLTLVSIFAVNRLLNLNKTTKSISEDSIPGIITAARINTDVLESQLRVNRLLRAKTPEARNALLGEIATLRDDTDKAYKDYEATIFADEDRKNFEELNKARDDYRTFRTRLVAISETNAAEAADLLDTIGRPLYTTYSKATGAIIQYNAKNGEKRGQTLAQEVAFATRLICITAAVALLIGISASLLSVKSITKVLSRVSEFLSEGAGQVKAAAGQVSTSSQSLAEGASEQAASVEETSSSLEEMSSMTKRNADNARTAKELANEARHAADTGATDMAAMNTAMEAIKNASAEIAKIIKTIDEIAFQTNILALNAAVEAARAGEAGMGFAVVAEEVRNLAQRSAQAARETADKIEGAISKTTQGVEISAKVAAGLGDIVTKIRKVDELVAEVAASSLEQSQGIDQINTAIGQMDKVTQSNAANAEESAAAAEELNAQAESLNGAVRELLALVGGSAGQHSSSVESHPRNGRLSSTVRVETKQAANISANEKKPLSQNGHSRQNNLVTASSSVKEIPMSDDFTDQ